MKSTDLDRMRPSTIRGLNSKQSAIVEKVDIDSLYEFAPAEEIEFPFNFSSFNYTYVVIVILINDSAVIAR